MFSIDTSGLIDGWVRYYSPTVFPTLWRQMEAAATSRIIVAVQDVLVELERQDDEVCQWARQHLDFAPLDADIQRAAAEVMARFPRLARGTRSTADPFVVGLARARGLSVVTAERPSNSAARPRIPDVCASFGVPCLSMLQMFTQLGWTF